MRRAVFIFVTIALIWQISHSATLKIGTSMDMSGIYKNIGKEIVDGFNIAFLEAKDTGVLGKIKVEQIIYDDSYDAYLSLKNVDKLVRKDKVKVLFATFGTPANVALAPRLSIYRIPLFFPITGASYFYIEKNKYLFTLLPSYKSESEKMVEVITKHGHKKLGIVYYPNQYGWDCEIFAKKKAEKNGIKVYKFPYRGKKAAESIATKVKREKITALYLIIPSKFVKSLILKLANIGYYPDIYGENYSSVDKVFNQLPPDVASRFKRVFVSRFLPVISRTYPLGENYLNALSKYAPNKSPSLFSFMGYFLASTFTKIISKVKNPTPEEIIRVAESIKNLDVGLSEKISYSKEDHIGLNDIYIYQWKNGTLRSIALRYILNY